MLQTWRDRVYNDRNYYREEGGYYADMLNSEYTIYALIAINAGTCIALL
jgi:hypothetical protein